jgi:hypothetical protein
MAFSPAARRSRNPTGDSPQRPRSSQRKAEMFFSVNSVASVVGLFFAAHEEVGGLGYSLTTAREGMAVGLLRDLRLPSCFLGGTRRHEGLLLTSRQSNPTSTVSFLIWSCGKEVHSPLRLPPRFTEGRGVVKVGLESGFAVAQKIWTRRCPWNLRRASRACPPC